MVPVRRSLLHVLPGGLHRIRHYGLLANGSRKASLALARDLLRAAAPHTATASAAEDKCGATGPTFVCRHCGQAMTIVETFTRGQSIRAPPTP